MTPKLELHILSLEKALIHTPEVPTYAIRIISSWDVGDLSLNSLLDKINSPIYLKQNRYFFDDVWPGMVIGKNPVMFNNAIAYRIISDFNKYKTRCESLLVNCIRGKNRSPAVAMALNDIFNLGHESEKLKKQFPETNWFVYRTLLTAVRLNPKLIT